MMMWENKQEKDPETDKKIYEKYQKLRNLYQAYENLI